MRLLIELTGLQSESRFRGIGRYARGLAKGLLRTSAGHEVWLALSANKAESVDTIKTQFKGFIPENRIVLYRVLDHIHHSIESHRWRRNASELLHEHFVASLGADVILQTSMFEGFNDDIVTSYCNLFKGSLRAVIGHDLIPMLAPERYLDSPKARSWYYDKLAAFRNSELFLTNSASTGLEIADHLGIDASHIANIMAGADEFVPEREASNAEMAALDRRLGISCPFFIYTANFEPRKNFEHLIAAFGRVASRSGVPHQLILVTSGPQSVDEMLRALAQKAGLAERDVVITKNLSDDELKQLYSRCVALVYPSLHEGFGLPVLEAMQCDAAVIGSNTSSIPEIVGLHEAMFDPSSVDDIAGKMMRVVNDHAFHNRLKQNAKTQRALFSWDKTASKAWVAMEKACETRDAQHEGSRHQDRYRTLIAALKALPHVGSSPSPDEWRMLANSIAENIETIEAIPLRFSETAKRTWRIEGPFDSNYSLAILNRELARALRASGKNVVLHSTEGPGDYLPNEKFLAHYHPDILDLWRDGLDAEVSGSIIVSRNLYPPRVNDANGDYNFLHFYAWEESRFPTEWVDEFNLHLDGITCNSSHVMKVLQDSGVIAPLTVCGCGVDHWERVMPSRHRSFLGKSFRFLHVSSCFPRKGVDVLLTAYGKAFRRSDDVTLLIKTFENPHNDIESQLMAARAADSNYPDVIVIFDELSDSELKALHQHCHILVAPSRAEGFGLPLAEAMLSGIPVIATAWSGQLDFCNENTAWLIDYSFAPARTHFELSGSVWAEPDVDHLATRMREAYQATPAQRAHKVEAGRRILLKHHTWRGVVRRLSDAVTNWTRPRRRKPIHIGWVTTFNCRCGVGSYSQFLIEHVPHKVTIFGAANDEKINPDDERVVRAWHKDTPGVDLKDLTAAIDRVGVDVLVIQFNYFFFDFSALETCILDQKRKGRTVIVELHSTTDPPDHLWTGLYPTKRMSSLRASFEACDRVLVHSYHDLNRLKEMGVVDNATLFPHGVVEGPPPTYKLPARSNTFTIGSYGFCLPHKGLQSLLKAFSLLASEDPQLRLHLVNAEYPAYISHQMAADLRAEIAALKISSRARMTSDFLPDHRALELLHACDLIVFPYQQTGESASGAVRFGIASGRPVLTTDLPIFEDIRSIVFQVESNEPHILASGLRRVIAQLRSGDPEVIAKAVAAEKWCRDNSYETLGARLSGLIEALQYHQRQ